MSGTFSSLQGAFPSPVSAQCPPFTALEAEAQRGKVACPGSHSLTESDQMRNLIPWVQGRCYSDGQSSVYDEGRGAAPL